MSYKAWCRHIGQANVFKGTCTQCVQQTIPLIWTLVLCVIVIQQPNKKIIDANIVHSL